MYVPKLSNLMPPESSNCWQLCNRWVFNTSDWATYRSKDSFKTCHTFRYVVRIVLDAYVLSFNVSLELLSVLFIKLFAHGSVSYRLPGVNLISLIAVTRRGRRAVFRAVILKNILPLSNLHIVPRRKRLCYPEFIQCDQILHICCRVIIRHRTLIQRFVIQFDSDFWFFLGRITTEIKTKRIKIWIGTYEVILEHLEHHPQSYEF